MALTRPKYSQIYDTDWKQSVEVATTADVGNLVTGNTQPTSLDGVNLQTNWRVLVKDQSSAEQNGLYIIRSLGTGSNGWWVRTLDASQSSFVTAGLTVTVVSGNINGGKEFRLTTPDPITLGITPLTFINPFAAGSAGGANTQVQFNDASTFSGTDAFTFNKYTTTLAVTGNVTANNLRGNIAGGSVLPNVYITGSLIPTANVAYDLGSPTQKFRSAYFSGNTVYIGGESMSVAADGTWSFTSKGAEVSLGADAVFNPPTADISGNLTAGNLAVSGLTSMAGNLIVANAYVTSSIGDMIYFDRAQNFIGFKDSSPDYDFDFTSTGGGELLHVESLNATQVWIGAQNQGGLHFKAGTEIDYVFSGSQDRPDHYHLVTNGIARANIHGSTGNIIFSNSISVGHQISADYVITPELRTNSSNITVRNDMTFLGDKNVLFPGGGTIFGPTQLGVGTQSVSFGTALYVTGGIAYIDDDVTITGNLFVNGNVTTFNANNLNISDSLIYLADDNTADIIDIGFVSSFTDAVRYQHTGLVRDASDGIWKLFANVVVEPTTTVDFTNAKYSTLQLGNIYAGGSVGAAGTYLSQTGSGLSWVALSANKINQNASNVSVDASYVNVAVNGSNVASFGSTNFIVGNILPTANNVSNIGSATSKFNTIHAKATQAQYADLAENYVGDYEYVPGTVLVFGGSNEVTVSTRSHDPAVAGVVSTNPAYHMNASVLGLPVALQGRVPTKVKGPVDKGDRVVASDIPGVAERLDMLKYQPGCIIGKSLEKIDDDSIQVIEVVVGRN